MPKYFPGVTYCLVRTPTNTETMKKVGDALAFVHLCFGSDEDYILVQIKKMEGFTSGVTAFLPYFVATSEDKTLLIPAIQGKVANEAKLSALIAFDQVKQKFGLKFGRRYKVYEKSVEEIKSAKSVGT